MCLLTNKFNFLYGLCILLLIITLIGGMVSCETVSASDGSTSTFDQSSTGNITLNGNSDEDEKMAGEWEVPKQFTFEKLKMEGTEYSTEQIEKYLEENRDQHLATMVNMGIYEGDDVQIINSPIYQINLENATVQLDYPFLFIIADNAIIDAARIRTENDEIVVRITGGNGWVSQIGRILKENPEKEYLLVTCGYYTCLLSSTNEVLYLYRPEGGVDLPFESGVDYYSKLYNEKIAFSYSTFFDNIVQ